MHYVKSEQTAIRTQLLPRNRKTPRMTVGDRMLATAVQFLKPHFPLDMTSGDGSLQMKIVVKEEKGVIGYGKRRVLPRANNHLHVIDDMGQSH